MHVPTTGQIQFRVKAITDTHRLYLNRGMGFIPCDQDGVVFAVEVGKDGKINADGYLWQWSLLRGDDDYDLMQLGHYVKTLLNQRNLSAPDVKFPLTTSRLRRYQIVMTKLNLVDAETLQQQVNQQVPVFDLEYIVTFKYRSVEQGSFRGTGSSKGIYDQICEYVVSNYQGDQTDVGFVKFLRDLRKDLDLSILFCHTHRCAESNRLWNDLDVSWTFANPDEQR